VRALVSGKPWLTSAKYLLPCLLLPQVLNGLHSQKRVAGVDAMLLRLYGPILFRALTAANSAVRRNSLLVMLDAFPLRVRAWAHTHIRALGHCTICCTLELL